MLRCVPRFGCLAHLPTNAFISFFYSFTWGAFCISTVMAMKSLTSCMAKDEEEGEEPDAAAQPKEEEADPKEAEVDKDVVPLPEDEEVGA